MILIMDDVCVNKISDLIEKLPAELKYKLIVQFNINYVDMGSQNIPMKRIIMMILSGYFIMLRCYYIIIFFNTVE